MANEIEGRLEELSANCGETSWNTEAYRRLYNKKSNKGIEVYEIKPWEVSVGDVLKLRGKEVLKELEEESLIPAHWMEELHTYFEENLNTLVVTEDIYDNIVYNRSVIHSHLFNEEEDLYWYFSLPMLMFAEPKVVKETEEEKKEEDPIYSVKAPLKDPKIIQEMIKKVDKKRLKNLLSISASYGENLRHIVSNEVVDEYLYLWANAKYEFYLLFNKELSISKDVDLEVTEEEMRALKRDLANDFPKYGTYVENMPTQYFISNEVNRLYDSCFSYAQQFFTGKGMKLSKFYSQFLQDTKFDIELSKVLQNKKVLGSVFLSIDPYDYLTSSINQHGWKSCHRITEGEYATGSLSYMLDETTIVSFRAKKDKEFSYNFWGIKFKGNSKLHRQLVYFDKKTCSIIFGRQYPNDNEQLSKEVRGLLEERVSEYLGVNNTWKVFKNKHDGSFTDISRLHYSDVKNDFDFKFVRLSDSRKDVAEWEVGCDVPCLCGCGEKVERPGERALCKSCMDKIGGTSSSDFDDDDDDDYEEDYED